MASIRGKRGSRKRVRCVLFVFSHNRFDNFLKVVKSVRYIFQDNNALSKGFGKRKSY